FKARSCDSRPIPEEAVIRLKVYGSMAFIRGKDHRIGSAEIQNGLPGYAVSIAASDGDDIPQINRALYRRIEAHARRTWTDEQFAELRISELRLIVPALSSLI